MIPGNSLSRSQKFNTSVRLEKSGQLSPVFMLLHDPDMPIILKPSIIFPLDHPLVRFLKLRRVEECSSNSVETGATCFLDQGNLIV